MNKRLTAMAAILTLLVAAPGLYSMGERLIAKRHITNGCKAFLSNYGADGPNVSIFQNEFSKAALSDPAYLSIAKASDSLDATRIQAANAGFEREWIDALGAIQGLCWSHFPKK